jgi:hypothetical protein
MNKRSGNGDENEFIPNVTHVAKDKNIGGEFW